MSFIRNSRKEEGYVRRFRADVRAYLDDVTSESAKQMVENDGNTLREKFGWSGSDVDELYERTYDDEYARRGIQGPHHGGNRLGIIGKEMVLQ